MKILTITHKFNCIFYENSTKITIYKGSIFKECNLAIEVNKDKKKQSTTVPKHLTITIFICFFISQSR